MRQLFFYFSFYKERKMGGKRRKNGGFVSSFLEREREKEREKKTPGKGRFGF